MHPARRHDWMGKPFIDRALHHLNATSTVDLTRGTRPRQPTATGAKPPGVVMRRLRLRPLFLTAKDKELPERGGTGDDNGLVVAHFRSVSDRLWRIGRLWLHSPAADSTLDHRNIQSKPRDCFSGPAPATMTTRMMETHMVATMNEKTPSRMAFLCEGIRTPQRIRKGMVSIRRSVMMSIAILA